MYVLGSYGNMIEWNTLIMINRACTPLQQVKWVFVSNSS